MGDINIRMNQVKHKVLVLSGKGGVGKSTVSANLAYGLAANPELQVRRSEAMVVSNVQVGILDIDICGPSIPRIMGVGGETIHQSGSGWSPVFSDGIAVMSIGFLLPNPDDAVIWRGPKKNAAQPVTHAEGMIKQFLKDVDWGQLDFLCLKAAGIAGAVIVTTPQEVSLLDVRKEITFCKKVGVPIIGVIENMSGFVCPSCKIFAPTTGGARRMCAEMGVPFLGQLPLDPRIGRCCDEGKSFLVEIPDSPASKAYIDIIQARMGMLKACLAGITG